MPRATKKLDDARADGVANSPHEDSAIRSALVLLLSRVEGEISPFDRRGAVLGVFTEPTVREIAQGRVPK